MIQPVIIKSNKYGINLILDAKLPFGELLEAVKAKFLESEKFFKNAKMAISFAGRELTEEEEQQIIDTITKNTSITILCIVDNNEEHAEFIRQQIEAFTAASAPQPELVYNESVVTHGGGEFYRGTLRSGQVLESVSSIVVIGDVNPGAQVISQGNVLILGSLKGNACAGAAGDTNCFIVALEMDPIQIQIGDVLAKSPDKVKKNKKTRKKAKKSADTEPQIAMAKDGNIYIESMTRDILNHL